jgi:hypothetical protein
MDSLDFLGGAGGCSVGQTEGNDEQEDAEPPPSETSDEGEAGDWHSLTVSIKNAAASHCRCNTCDGVIQRSGGHGTRTRNPIRGAAFRMRLLAIRLPSGSTRRLSSI